MFLFWPCAISYQTNIYPTTEAVLSFTHIDFRLHEYSVFFLIPYCQIRLDLVQINLQLESICLDINISVPFGPVLDELIVNKPKHALPGGISGNLCNHLYLDYGHVFIIRDDDVGFAPDIVIRGVLFGIY